MGEVRYRAAWPALLCLMGLDYFSSLAYQPSIAYSSAGPLAPVATLALIAITMFAALPVYFYVAGRSPDGKGAPAMIERAIRGWWGKIAIVILLGFSATDFVVTRTLSAAD